MIEVQLFGWLFVTLPTAVSMVLVLVALTSVTYLAMTLAPALEGGPGGRRFAGARTLGLGVTAAVLGAAIAGLRVGAAGVGGELIPTLALGVAVAAACGATTALAALGAGALASRASLAGAQRRTEIQGARVHELRQLKASQRAFLDGDDVRAEVLDANAALMRLGDALNKLSGTHAMVEARLSALDDAALGGDLGRELRRTRDEVAVRYDLGFRIHVAATAAAFRLACSAPLRILLRRRPRDVAGGLTGADDGAGRAALAAAVASLDAFLGEADLARGMLAALEGRRPAPGAEDERDDDAWGLAMRDLAAIEEAYEAVRDRLTVVGVRLDARADMEAVAAAAGEVSSKARASGIPAGDLQDLVDEVARAESAILMATPAELDARSLSDMLARSATALEASDGASLDELLRALREVA